MADLPAEREEARAGQARALRFSALAILFCLALPLPRLLAHTSSDPVVLGRYSAGFAAFCLGYGLAAVAWTVLTIRLWGRAEDWLARTAALRRSRLLILALAAAPWMIKLIFDRVLEVSAQVANFGVRDGTLLAAFTATVGALALIEPPNAGDVPARPGLLTRLKARVPLHVVVALISAALFGLVMLRSAWLSDDAYITLRTVDNFASGYGLTWNITERVQAYTHPLWMFLLSAGYVLTREAYLTTIGLSAAVSLAAVLALALGLARTPQAALLGTAILTVSKAFIDYSTSGLENPLTHLLLALFLLVYFRPGLSTRKLALLALIAALAALNRIDTLAFMLPALAWMLFRLRRWQGLLALAVGFLPLAAWEVFSLLYYGFPFPNTVYAKLFAIDVSRAALVRQGLFYFLSTVRIDPITAFGIGLGMAAPLAARQRDHLPVSAGIGLYLLYVISIGGDFMTGRFFSAPLFGAVALLVRLPAAALTVRWRPALAGLLLVGLLSPYTPLRSGADYSEATFARRGWPIDIVGIADERAFYYHCTGLLNWRPDRPYPGCDWAQEGRAARTSRETVIERPTIGFFGYFAGPDKHILDIVGLADPLLARLPAIPGSRVGHYAREVPAGYLETLRSSQNRLADPGLAAYYDVLRLITRGRLLDGERLRAIAAINTGWYDDLLEGYRQALEGEQDAGAGH